METGGDGANGTGKQCGAKRLNEQIAADGRQPAAEAGAGASTDCDQQQAERVRRAENHAKGRRSGRRKERETCYRNRRKSRDCLKCRPRRRGVEAPVADVIDNANCRGYLAHIHARRSRSENPIPRAAAIGDQDGQLAPAGKDDCTKSHSGGELVESGHDLFGGLTILEQQPCA
ncbi:MAG TPA: hypothetical protein VGO01_05680, partial [Bradyrhizobium sp.]|nr:hypothetical protein [Bradyrhizobium sp.]